MPILIRNAECKLPKAKDRSTSEKAEHRENFSHVYPQSL